MEEPLSENILENLREHAAEASGLLKALANENRLMILCTLLDQELSVGALNSRIDLSQSALSQHLAVLRDKQLVRTRRQGTTIYYSVTPGPVAEIIEVLQKNFCPS